MPGKHTDFARASFAKHGPKPGPAITLIEGPAADTLPTLAGRQYDLIFIDADKPGYAGYLDTIMRLGLLAPSGVILADNVLHLGLVADPSPATNPHARDPDYGPASIHRAATLDEFNKMVLADERLESVILPVFDGVSFVRRKY